MAAESPSSNDTDNFPSMIRTFSSCTLCITPLPYKNEKGRKEGWVGKLGLLWKCLWGRHNPPWVSRVFVSERFQTPIAFSWGTLSPQGSPQTRMLLSLLSPLETPSSVFFHDELPQTHQSSYSCPSSREAPSTLSKEFICMEKKLLLHEAHEWVIPAWANKESMDFWCIAS